MMQDREHAQWNDEMVLKYDPDQFHHHRNPAIRWVEGRRVRAVVEAMGACEGRILEVGCGAGNVLETFQNGSLYGVDLSRHILSQAAQRLAGHASLTCASGERLPYADGSFAGVLCTEVIEHVLNPGAVLEEIVRVLRPTGTLAVSVPNEDLIDRLKAAVSVSGLYRLVFASGTFESPRQNEWHLHRFNRQRLVDLVPDALHLERVVPIPASALPLRYVAVMTKRDA